MSTKSRGFCPFSLVLFAGTAYSYVKHLQSKSKQKNEQNSTMTSKCRPVVICGPSGVGKGTLIELLQKHFPDGKFGVSTYASVALMINLFLGVALKILTHDVIILCILFFKSSVQYQSYHEEAT